MLRPNPEEVAGFNAEIRQRLLSAMEYLVVDVLGQLPPNTWSSAPAVHALQALMRQAAVNGDLEEIRALYSLHAQVASSETSASRDPVLGWSESDLSRSELDLLQTAFEDDIGLTACLSEPNAGVVARIRTDVARIRLGLNQSVPRWAQEFDALVSMIVLAETENANFAGASAFSAWGAILVNPLSQKSDLALLLTMIHESSHLKLFYAYLEDEVVLNDPKSTFSSPLRSEHRPMNGLFHAAFVLARMVCFVGDLRQSGKIEFLPAVTLISLGDVQENLAKQFDASYSVIVESAVLTKRGETIIQEAAAGVKAMREAAPAALK